MSEDGLEVKESVSRGNPDEVGMGIRNKVSEQILVALRQHLESRIPVGYRVVRKGDWLYIYRRRRILPDRNLGDVVRMFEDDRFFWPFTISWKVFPSQPWPWIALDDLKAILQPVSHYIDGKLFVTRDVNGAFIFARFSLRSPRDLGKEALANRR